MGTIQNCEKGNEYYRILTEGNFTLYSNVEEPLDDYYFSWLIHNRIRTRTLHEMCAFSGFEENEIQKLFKGEKITHKWHLLVSYIAYKELDCKFKFYRGSSFCVNGEFDYYKKAGARGGCKCPELMLWMADPEGKETKESDLQKVKEDERVGEICQRLLKIYPWDSKDGKTGLREKSWESRA